MTKDLLKDKDSVDLEALMIEGQNIAGKMGQLVYNMGTHALKMAMGVKGPMLAASEMIRTAEHMHKVADQVVELSNKIVDWDQNRIITKM